MWLDGLLVVFVVTGFKLLLIPSYRSTDFEVHRNWLAITYSQPLSNWYYEATSKWTLDYPPLFAWFEFGLSHVAALFDPKMLLVHSIDYSSPKTVLFQRLSVIVSDLLLFYGVYRLSTALYAGNSQRQNTEEQILYTFVLVVLHPGLLLVDHIHFQYNGLMLGLLFLSAAHIVEGSVLAGALWFAVLLNVKHIFLYVALVYFVHLLRIYCFTRSSDTQRRTTWPLLGTIINLLRQFSTTNFVKLGLVVSFVFLLSFGPFVVNGQLGQVLRRMFPFGRGLLNAYWAPNFWALYTVLDKTLVLASKIVGMAHLLPERALQAGGMTRGLTNVGSSDEVPLESHVLLPTIRPIYTLLITLIVLLPALSRLWDQRKNDGALFVLSLVRSSMAFFMFSWHVHEKAVLMPAMTLTFLAFKSAKIARLSFFTNVIAVFSLFPLLFEAREYPIKLLLLACYTAMSYVLMVGPLPPQEEEEEDKDTKSGNEAKKHINLLDSKWVKRLELCFLAGIPLLEFFVSIVHPSSVFDGGQRLAFLPLMLMSTYCAVGLAYVFVSLYFIESFDIRIGHGATKYAPLKDQQQRVI